MTLAVTNPKGRDAAIWYRLASLFSVVAANADSGTGERLLAGAGQWLAGEFCEQLPQELDFNQLAPLPRQWVNNGFAGWNGEARIEQPPGGVCHHPWKRRHLHRVISSLFQTLRLIKDMRLISSVWNRWVMRRMTIIAWKVVTSLRLHQGNQQFQRCRCGLRCCNL